MTVSPLHPIHAQLPPVDESPSKSFDIRKYKTAATTLLRSSRGQELRKLNQTILACHLPIEVLQNIFLTCARLSVNLPTWSWVEITNVCSTWRQAALLCWELWSHIDFSQPRWTFLTLYRSQMLPISVRATLRDNNQHSIQRTLQYASRIQDVHLISSLRDISPLLWTLHSPNQFLESMLIEISQPDDHDDIRYSKRCPPLRDSLLPALKYLELHRAPFSLVSPRHTGLTHLSLHHLPPSERPARRDFFALLGRFTVLQHLTLERAFPRMVSGTPHHRPVILPRLLSISLTGSIPELTSTLDSVILPASCQLLCKLDRMSDFKTSFWKLAKAIGVHFHDIASEMPLCALVLMERESSLRFTENHTLNPEFQQSLRIRAFGHSEALLDVVLGPDSHTCHDEVIVGGLIAIWEALPLAHIQTLTLQGVDVITHRTWQRLLPALHSLRVLDIGCYAPFGLIWALLLNARSHSHLEHDDTSTLLLPGLVDIYLSDIDCFVGGLMTSSSSPVNSHCDRDDSRFLDVLFTYLEDRQRCNLEPRSLCISRCQNVLREVLRDLKNVVEHLAWDGRGVFKLNPFDNSILANTVTYRSYWPSQAPPVRHYFRLQRLLESD